MDNMHSDSKILRTINDSPVYGILVLDADLRIHHWNEEGRMYLGLPSEGLRGTPILDFPWDVVDASGEKMTQDTFPIARSQQTGMSIRDVVMGVKRPGDESRLWLLVHADPVVEENGTVRNIFCTFLDYTHVLATRRLPAILYEISESAHVTDDLGTLYQAIHAAISHLMPAKNFYIALYDEEEDLIRFPYVVDEVDDSTDPIKSGSSLTDYVIRTGKPLLASPEVFAKLIASGEVKSYGADSIDWLGVPLTTQGKTIGVLAVQSYDPTIRFTEANKEILSFVSEQVAMAIERKQRDEIIRGYVEDLQATKSQLEERARELDVTNDQLRVSEASLRESNVNKDKFFSIISHDLRSPFTSVLGYSDYILNDFENLSRAELKDLVKEIHTSSQRVFALLENLLQWSRIQTGKLKCQPVMLDVKEFVNGIMVLLQEQAFRKNIRLINATPPGVSMFGDQTMMTSVVQNLLSNAVKFTPAGGSITVEGQRDGQCTRVRVTDTGVGITPEDQAKLFRMDVHHSTSGTAKEPGTGLGLILCKELVDRNRGRIWIDSSMGEGTTFTFELPSLPPSDTQQDGGTP